MLYDHTKYFVISRMTSSVWTTLTLIYGVCMKKLTWYLKLLHKPENVVWNGEVSAVTGAAPFSADTSPCVKHRLVKACQHGAATDTSGNRSAQGILGLYIKPHTTHRVYNPSQNTVREAQASQLGAATDAAGNRSAQGILGLYIKPHTTHRVHNPSQHRSWSTGLSAWCSNRYCWESLCTGHTRSIY